MTSLGSNFDAKTLGFLKLESSSCSENITRSLRSEIRDGLWMLCRQWQMGEFLGEDAATPHKVQIASASYAVNQLDSGNSPLNHQPIEPAVEGEGLIHNLYTRIQTGQYLQSLLIGNGLEDELAVIRERYNLAQI